MNLQKKKKRKRKGKCNPFGRAKRKTLILFYEYWCLNGKQWGFLCSIVKGEFSVSILFSSNSYWRILVFFYLPCLLFSCPTGFVYALAAYITTSINDGPGCLTLRCPDPSCDAAIGQDMIDTLTSGEDKDKYNRYLLRSYIEDNRKVGAKCC